jgi:flagellar basal body-associated protein FliL
MNSPNTAIMQSIEQLNYRVTVGDVATKSGLDLNIVQQELLKLAQDTNGNLQVAETGDIAYLFPQNFRSILNNKYWQLRWQKALEKTWKIVFYLIRISFGILLVSSIILMLIAIVVIVIVINSKADDNNDNNSDDRRGGGGFFFFPRFWFSPDIFWIFTPDYQQRRYQRQLSNSAENQLNFLESIYSFLFGDGNPNSNLEDKRWRSIATVIENNNGAIIAEQLAPYLDNINNYNEGDEGYILPVLTRFNGYPEVSEKGEIIYYFPELQVKAQERKKVSVLPYLKENLWTFSLASSSQKMLAVGLGAVNIVLALVLGSLLTSDIAEEIGGFISLIQFLYPLLLTYAISYLTIPLIRYFWLQNRNNKVKERNYYREEKANLLQCSKELELKINYAQNFANQTIISQGNLAYSTEKDLLDQQLEQKNKIDDEWRKKIEN